MNLNSEQKRIVLDIATSESGQNTFYLEKDVWIVWTLQQLFSAPFGNNLVFNGGTSLSKAYNIIDRFSEDIDITYDIRAIASDLIVEGSMLPATNSQARRWTKEIRKRLAERVANVVKPYIEGALKKEQIEAVIIVNEDTLKIGDYIVE